MTACTVCGALFTAPDPPWSGWLSGDARAVLCPDHLAVWRAERDQFYAECREANLRACEESGHVRAGRGCARCGASP
jgi:hypothetical protein